MTPDASDINSRRIEKPWGHEVIFTPPGWSHTGKLLFIRAGQRLSLQYHDAKEEVMCLQSGRALLWLDGPDGEMRSSVMEPSVGHLIGIGRKHRLEALEDSCVLEVSDPERGNTFRLADDFARPDETEALRHQPNRGWSGIGRPGV